jgi:hypothetical protein
VGLFAMATFGEVAEGLLHSTFILNCSRDDPSDDLIGDFRHLLHKHEFTVSAVYFVGGFTGMDWDGLPTKQITKLVLSAERTRSAIGSPIRDVDLYTMGWRFPNLATLELHNCNIQSGTLRLLATEMYSNLKILVMKDCRASFVHYPATRESLEQTWVTIDDHIGRFTPVSGSISCWLSAV